MKILFIIFYLIFLIPSIQAVDGFKWKIVKKNEYANKINEQNIIIFRNNQLTFEPFSPTKKIFGGLKKSVNNNSISGTCDIVHESKLEDHLLIEVLVFQCSMDGWKTIISNTVSCAYSSKNNGIERNKTLINISQLIYGLPWVVTFNIECE